MPTDPRPCRDDEGVISAAHEWSDWVERPADMQIRKPTDPEMLRCCGRCNRYEALTPTGVKIR